MHTLETDFSTGWEWARLPVPMPSAEAIDAGLFGIDETGAVIPSAEDVRAITAEQARELCWILLELDYLGHCSRRGVHSISGKGARTLAGREALTVRLTRAAELLGRQYDDSLAIYAEGFGWEGAAALDRFVKENLPLALPEHSIHWQQDLF